MTLTPRFALRAAVLALATAALVIPAAPAALAATPACEVIAKPLGDATGYTEFVSGNGSRGSESEGAIAYGGNLNANGMTVGTLLSSAASDPTLVVAGTHGSTFNLQKGSAYLNPANGVNFNGGQGTGYLASNPINFSSAFTTLTSRSATWGAATANGTTSVQTLGGQSYRVLSGTDATLNIFSLTPALLAGVAGIAYDVPAGSTVLVNVSGTSVTLSGQMGFKQGTDQLNQASDGVVIPAWSKILWNFPDATSVTMNFGSAWAGTILAPKANVAVNQVGHTIGQVIAAQFSSNFETHQNLFDAGACLPPLSQTPAENPSIQLTKTASAIDDNDNNGTDAGDTITYSFAVKNTGNVALSTLTLTDPLLGGAMVCPSGSLASGSSTTCTSKTYTITASDMAAGKVVNSATITGKSPAGTSVSSDSSVTTTLTATKANLKVAKSVDKTSPRVGDTVTYTLTASNDGPAAAAGVVLTDTLPAGITFVSASNGCTYASGTVTCAVGTIAAGGSTSVQVKATVDALPAAGSSTSHDLDVQKNETQLSIQAGQTATVTAVCPTGYLAVDGSGRIDHVDQGTGTFSDVKVTESYASAPDTWTVTMKNGTTGQAQGKAFVVCLRSTTSVADGHSHPIVVSAPISQQVALPNGTGTTLTCGAGQVPVAPGFRLDAPADVTSVPSGNQGWTFAASGSATTGTFSISCLSTKTGEAAGHQHDLALNLLHQTVTVPAGETDEFQLTCSDNAKGIVAGEQLSPGLVKLGNDPRPKTRAFQISNPTSGPLTADLSLLCLDMRTAGAASTGTITNTATGSTSTPETSYGDNSGSATFTVNTAPLASPSVAVSGSTVSVSPSAVATTLTCSGTRTTCTGTVTLVAAKTQRVAGHLVRKGTVLAKATFKIAHGKKAVVHLKATKAGAKVLRAKALKKAQLRIGYRSKTVAVRH